MKKVKGYKIVKKVKGKEVSYVVYLLDISKMVYEENCAYSKGLDRAIEFGKENAFKGWCV